MARDPILTAYAEEYGDWRAYGWTVERYGREWILRDPDGTQRMIANYGGLAPTQTAAILEAYARIASDARAYAANGWTFGPDYWHRDPH